MWPIGEESAFCLESISPQRGVKMRCVVATLPRRHSKDSPALSATTYSFTIQEKIMRTLRYVFAAFLLASALSIPAFAGNIHTGAPQPDPSPPAEGGTSATVDGDMHTMNNDEATSDGTVAEAALSLLQGVLALL
jgi:hypothetical protein